MADIAYVFLPPPSLIEECSSPSRNIYLMTRQLVQRSLKRCSNECSKSTGNALSSFATVMPMRKRGSLGRNTVKSKEVEHTRAAEAPDEKRARLQAD
ncbi:hypothetical protein TNIN_498941 [Trichonephila inaurata madagascariensis]|uniref:Uncharacterized protein n=1 Tax=Trichonephila inaurata madagascariensis TaxID=2747483 RepID=A0A8X6WRQ0_9ARAC|nr:hypothetical protein TNIN_498941 [Trichonephila inaurata madagascariensis]